MILPATLSLADAAGECWDALVVGAGPAGSVTARELARLGVRVLLVDRSVFPRWKVCGCCLLQPGLNTLSRMGLGHLPKRLGAVPLTSVRFSIGGFHARLPMSGGVVLSRDALDAGLIQAAIGDGVQFLPETSARLHSLQSDSRRVSLQHAGLSAIAAARIIVAADGLGGQLAAHEPGLEPRIRHSSRIGFGCAVPGGSEMIQSGEIEMAAGRAGYVGVVRLEDGRVCIAAALDLTAVRHADGPGRVAMSILAGAGVAMPMGLAHAAWRGTPPLTRSQKRHWADRLFVVGDSAGYVEPFTGEGIASALASTQALAPLAAEGCKAWRQTLGPRWDAAYSRAVKTRQSTVRAMSLILRRPWLASKIVALLSLAPSLAIPFERQLNHG